MKRAYIETYGCQMNISDSELMAGILAEQGFVATDKPDDADVILVNTCAIRDHAEQRVIGRVGQLQQYRREGAAHRRDRLHGAAHGRKRCWAAPAAWTW